MKKLIPALCMLLVAAALLGTSTFAWFSMTTQVTASGMTVKAATSKNLVISTTSTLKDNEGISKDSTISQVKILTPASTATLAGTQKFFTTDNENINYSDGAMKAGTVVTAVTPITDNTTEKGNVVKHTFYIRADGADTDSFTKLYVESITLTSQAAAITKALRVGVVSGDKGYIYAPVSGATTSYKGLVKAETYTVGDTNQVLSTENVTLTTVGSVDATLGAVTSTAYTQVDVYIWYEGQDENCTSANAVTVEETSISIVFKAV